MDGSGAQPYGAGYNNNICLRWDWDCWLNNVTSTNADGNHVYVELGGRNEIRDSYFNQLQNAGGSENYGVVFAMTSSSLLENNAFNGITGPIVLGTSSGSVVGYNVTTNEIYTTNLGYMGDGLTFHDAYNYMNLVEGNWFNKQVSDFYHGNAGYNTMYRNRIPGWTSTITEGTSMTGALESGYDQVYSYYFNYVGNILGTTNVSVYYTNPTGDNGNPSVYSFGDGIPGDGYSACVTCVSTTMFRHANYDYVSNTQINSNGFTTTLPNSLYLTNTPAFYTNCPTCPFPPYNPTIPTSNSSTNIPAGHNFQFGGQL